MTAAQTEKTAKQLRAERAARARREHNEQVKAEKAAAKPARKPRAVKTVIPETVEHQAARALAALQEAELRRPQNLPVIPEKASPARRVKGSTVRATPSKVVAGNKGDVEFDLDKAVESMNLEFLQCRDFGHSWRPHTARWVQASNAYESQLRCQRCRAIRTRWLSRTGAQLGGSYDYSEGYIIKGMGRLAGSDRDKIRLASIMAVLVPDAAED